MWTLVDWHKACNACHAAPGCRVDEKLGCRSTVAAYCIYGAVVGQSGEVLTLVHPRRGFSAASAIIAKIPQHRQHRWGVGGWTYICMAHTLLILGPCFILPMLSLLLVKTLRHVAHAHLC